MRRYQVVMQRNGMGHEFDNAGVRCEGEHLIGADAQVPLASSLVVFEKTADLLKHLFHDRVLPQVVVTSLEL